MLGGERARPTVAGPKNQRRNAFYSRATGGSRKGGSQNECPAYASNTQVISLCMQQMWDEGLPPTSSCAGTCYEEHGHYINMNDPSVTKVACGFFTTAAGKVWAAQNFSR
jgi:hypothetical protein